MIHVRAEVRPSRIHGLGLFAVDAIPRGTLVSLWDPTFDRAWTAVEYEALPMVVRDDLEIYGWRDGEDWRADAGHGRFRNHSFAPNIGSDGRAVRDIAAGEELTEDYRAFDPDFDDYACTLWVYGPTEERRDISPSGGYMEDAISDEEASQILREAGIDVDAELKRSMALVDKAEATALKARKHER